MAQLIHYMIICNVLIVLACGAFYLKILKYLRPIGVWVSCPTCYLSDLCVWLNVQLYNKRLVTAHEDAAWTRHQHTLHVLGGTWPGYTHRHCIVKHTDTASLYRHCIVIHRHCIVIHRHCIVIHTDTASLYTQTLHHYTHRHCIVIHTDTASLYTDTALLYTQTLHHYTHRHCIIIHTDTASLYTQTLHRYTQSLGILWSSIKKHTNNRWL